MKVCWHDNELTNRVESVTLMSDSFDDERLLQAIVEVVRENGLLTAKTRRRILKYRFTKNQKTTSQP